jgi:2-polyprenyl-6-methoxyphenol hydroxylase-like FAD-dependent oxidoreductase
MRQYRIAIIGGGPGGLTLARLLHLGGLSATIFERDAHAGDRPQGGTLDLHADTGQRALRLAGLEREFLAAARYDDQGMRLYDSDGVLLFGDDTSQGDRPEVDRAELRRMLIDSLPPAMIRWGTRVDRIEPTDDGRHDVIAGGVRESFDLVVGADGAWSKVRPLLSDARPAYEGVTFVELGFDDVDRRHPAIAALAGRGKMFALGDNRGLILQRNGHAHIRGYFSLRTDEPWAIPLEDAAPDTIRERMLGYLKGWAPAFTDAIRSADTIIGVRPLYALPVGHRWAHRPGLTLIGDAAHLMSPFGGEGVNLAMTDAADLAAALIQGDDTATARFEEAMAARAEPAARGATEGLYHSISPKGPEAVLVHFMEVMAGA